MPVEAAVGSGDDGDYSQQSAKLLRELTAHAGRGRAQDHDSNSLPIIYLSGGDRLSLTATIWT